MWINYDYSFSLSKIDKSKDWLPGISLHMINEREKSSSAFGFFDLDEILKLVRDDNDNPIPHIEIYLKLQFGL